MIALNKVLQNQLKAHFGSLENIPSDLRPFLKTINETYDRMGSAGNVLVQDAVINEENAKGIRDILIESFFSHGGDNIGTDLFQPGNEVFAELNVADSIKAVSKLAQAKRGYAMISGITQAIARAENETDLFEKAGTVIKNTGPYRLSWIDVVGEGCGKTEVVSYGVQGGDKEFAVRLAGEAGSPTRQVRDTGASFVCNDIAGQHSPEAMRKYCAAGDLHSCLAVPVKKRGAVAAVLSLYARKKDFFDSEEIAFVEEVAAELSFALDVFEKEALRIKVEKRLQHSEAGLKQAQAIAHFGSWEMDLSTGLALWSDEACRIYGLPTEDNVHSLDSWASFIHPEDLPSFMKVLTGGVESLTSNAAFYHRIYRKDGSTRFAYTQTKYELDTAGMPVLLYGVTHDVTGVKEAQEALIQSKANLRLLIDLIPQAIYARDQNGKFVFVNQNYAALFGLEAQKLLDKTIDQIIPPGNDLETLIAQDREVLSSGKALEIPEATFTDHKGVTRKYYSVKVPFSTAKNEKAVLGISLNITEQLQADAERKKIIADIMQRNNSLEQFSYIISHNLRAPVANIIGIKDVLQHSDNTEEEKQYLTTALFNAVEKLDTVIMDINHILQIKHQVNEKKEVVRFSEIIDDIKISISNLMRHEEVEIVCDFAKAEEILTVKSYLYSIFYNLISNSIKYRKHDLKPVIQVSTGRVNESIEIIFKDNGLGIDMDKHRERLFGLYKRFHNHTEGRGMGLYMVKTQVETLGGKISMTSKVDKGTKFRIEFDAG